MYNTGLKFLHESTQWNSKGVYRNVRGVSNVWELCPTLEIGNLNLLDQMAPAVGVRNICCTTL